MEKTKMILIELKELNRRLAERFCFNCTKDCTFCEIKEVSRIMERMPIYELTDSVGTEVGADYLDSYLKFLPDKAERDIVEKCQRERYKP